LGTSKAVEAQIEEFLDKLVPVSSSQAVISAILGIGLLRGKYGIRWSVLGGIGLGWLLTPIAAAVLCYTTLWTISVAKTGVIIL
jgi:phosphate/sulfate permease